MKLTFSTGRPVLDGDKLILSVGENPVLLHARYKLLTAAGYGVMNATGGLQAMTMFGEHPIDLVLLAHPLPDIDGGNGGGIYERVRASDSDHHGFRGRRAQIGLSFDGYLFAKIGKRRSAIEGYS